jgi:hypothetical protein
MEMTIKAILLFGLTTLTAFRVHAESFAGAKGCSDLFHVPVTALYARLTITQ